MRKYKRKEATTRMMNRNGLDPEPASLGAEPVIQLLLTSRSVVYPWQCDHMGHMNVMWYTGEFDEATWPLLAHIGITPS